jgi:hypothetical protein
MKIQIQTTHLSVNIEANGAEELAFALNALKELHAAHAEEPSETLTETITEEPAETLDPELLAALDQAFGDALTEEPAQALDPELLTALDQTFGEELTEEPTEEPAEELTEEPTEEPAEEPAEEPTEEPAEELTEEPTEEPEEPACPTVLAQLEQYATRAQTADFEELDAMLDEMTNLVDDNYENWNGATIRACDRVYLTVEELWTAQQGAEPLH